MAFFPPCFPLNTRIITRFIEWTCRVASQLTNDTDLPTFTPNNIDDMLCPDWVLDIST